MEGIRLEYQYEEGKPKIVVELNRDSSLTDLLEGFGAFLLAAGYSYNGHLDIVEEEEANVSSAHS